MFWRWTITAHGKINMAKFPSLKWFTFAPIPHFFFFQGEQLCRLFQLQILPAVPFLLHTVLCVHCNNSLSVFPQILGGELLKKQLINKLMTDSCDRGQWCHECIYSCLLPRGFPWVSTVALLFLSTRASCQTGVQSSTSSSSCLWRSCSSSVSCSSLVTTVGWWPKTDRL